MKLSDLYKEERELSVAIGDDALHVTYRPAAYTPLLEAMLQDSVAAGRPSQALAEALCALLVDWDLFNDDDEKLAINKSTLMSLPVGALAALLSEIGQDIAANPTSFGPSAAGSKRRGATESRRDGTG
jgi:hypothetical protein